MKYSNQINMFLAIAGCIIALWVFSQTYFQPIPDTQLEMSEFFDTGNTVTGTQIPASYESESTTVAGPLNFDSGTRRTPAGSSSPGRNPSAGGGSFQRENSPVRQPNSSPSGSSISRALQSSGRQSPRETTVPESSPEATDGDESRPSNVGGFQLPPAGQAQGMEQSKRTPEDNNSNRRYVPFRSSMASRPN